MSSGMLLTPSEALNVKNGAPPIDTPTAANGAVVCGPRLSANDLRFSTLTLKPEPVLWIIYLVGTFLRGFGKALATMSRETSPNDRENISEGGRAGWLSSRDVEKEKRQLLLPLLSSPGRAL